MNMLITSLLLVLIGQSPVRTDHMAIRGTLFVVDVQSNKIVLVHPTVKDDVPRPSSVITIIDETQIYQDTNGQKIKRITLKDVDLIVKGVKLTRAVAIVKNPPTEKQDEKYNRYTAVIIILFTDEN